MNKRQRRADEDTANAVARGLNILRIRNRQLAERYMAYKRVPQPVILRVLAQPDQCRRLSETQSISEALTPSRPADED